METFYHYVITPIVVFIVGWLLLRVMGKKAVKEMSGTELIVVMILGTAISEPVVDKSLGRASWYSFMVALTYIAFAHFELNNKLKRWIDPEATVLIRDGVINEKGLKEARFTVEQLLAQLRVKGYTDVKDIKLAMLEQTGEFSAIPNADSRPVQPKDIKLAVSPAYMPIPIIIDGEVQENNLRYINKTYEWLYAQLGNYSLKENQLREVMLATLNVHGCLDVFMKTTTN